MSDISLIGMPDFDRLEIVKTVYGSVAAVKGTVATATTAHGLGYTPIIIGFVRTPTYQHSLPYVDTISESATEVLLADHFRCRVDSTNVYFDAILSNGSVSATWNYIIYVCRYRANAS